MRLSKPTENAPAAKKGGKKGRYHASVEHHKGSTLTHHVGSYGSAEECKAQISAKYPNAHKIMAKPC